MDSGHRGHSLSRHLPPLPADIADRIIRALAAESDRRREARSSDSATQFAVPLQRTAGQSAASYVPRPRRSPDHA